MKMLLLLVASGLSLFLSGCVQPFARVPFSYSSATHLPPKQAFATSMLSPEDVIYLMSENLRAANAEIVFRGRSTSQPSLTADADACWEANNETVRQEFVTYNANDFHAFRKIDRTAIFLRHGVSQGCSWVVMNKTDDPQALRIEARLRTRLATASISVPTVVQSFKTTRFNGNIGQSGSVPYAYSGSAQTNGLQIGTTDRTVKNTVDTIYNLWVGPMEGGGSTLYAVALPESDGVVAEQGSSIGYLWWRQVDGVSEAGIVRDFFYRLDEEEHALRASTSR